MISGTQRVILADIDSIADSNLNRSKNVTRGKILALNVDLVGIQTMQLGKANGYEYSYSVRIARRLYDKEKYCYFCGELYEIKSLGKASKPDEMLLNVIESNDIKSLNAIKEWISKNDN